MSSPFVCSLCDKVISQPQVFVKCRHSFCNQCCHSMIQQSNEAGVCGICSRSKMKDSSIVLGNSLEKDLGSSFVEPHLALGGLVGLIETLSVNLKENTTKSCFICYKVPQFSCDSCQLNLCQECMNLHHQGPVFVHHRVRSCKNKFNGLLCPKDDQELLFCQDCSDFFCLKCEQESHIGHITKSQNYQVKSLRNELMSIQHELVSDLRSHLLSHEGTLLEEENTLKKQLDELEGKLKNISNLKTVLEERSSFVKLLTSSLDQREILEKREVLLQLFRQQTQEFREKVLLQAGISSPKRTQNIEKLLFDPNVKTPSFVVKNGTCAVNYQGPQDSFIFGNQSFSDHAEWFVKIDNLTPQEDGQGWIFLGVSCSLPSISDDLLSEPHIYGVTSSTRYFGGKNHLFKDEIWFPKSGDKIRISLDPDTGFINFENSKKRQKVCVNKLPKGKSWWPLFGIMSEKDQISLKPF